MKPPSCECWKEERNTSMLSHSNEKEKNQLYCRTLNDVYHINLFFALLSASRSLNGTRKTSIRVEPYRSFWGSLLNTYPQSLSNINCDSLCGIVLTLTWYRGRTVTKNASMHLKVVPCGFCFQFCSLFFCTIKTFIHFFPFQLIIYSINFFPPSKKKFMPVLPSISVLLS